MNLKVLFMMKFFKNILFRASGIIKEETLIKAGASILDNNFYSNNITYFKLDTFKDNSFLFYDTSHGWTVYVVNKNYPDNVNQTHLTTIKYKFELFLLKILC
jgi:hypothetical protein